VSGVDLRSVVENHEVVVGHEVTVGDSIVFKFPFRRSELITQESYHGPMHHHVNGTD